MIHKLRLKSILGNFKIKDHTLEYEDFMARFYNMCIDEGMEHGKIMPSRAFCSDESQGMPIILITKHFSAFPFNHGIVGGIMAEGRNGAYAHHGNDLAIIQASHVGYDKDTGHFGRYRRLQRMIAIFHLIVGRFRQHWIGIKRNMNLPVRIPCYRRLGHWARTI